MYMNLQKSDIYQLKKMSREVYGSNLKKVALKDFWMVKNFSMFEFPLSNQCIRSHGQTNILFKKHI